MEDPFKLYTENRKLNGHDNAVWDIDATNEYVYSAGFDGKINEWDVNNGNLMHTFNITEGEEGHKKSSSSSSSIVLQSTLSSNKDHEICKSWKYLFKFVFFSMYSVK